VHLLDQRDQAGAFRSQPAPRVAAHDVADERLHRLCATLCARVDEDAGKTSCADVLVGDRGKASPDRILRLGVVEAFPGEVPQQIVQPVSDEAGGVHAGDVDQCRVRELLQEPFGFVTVCSEGRGEVPCREISIEQA
jgi:hypothetical protein